MEEREVDAMNVMEVDCASINSKELAAQYATNAFMECINTDVLYVMGDTYANMIGESTTARNARLHANRVEPKS